MNDLSLSSAIRRAFNNRLAEIHTALPGKIEKYDHIKQKADIKPLIKKQYYDGTIDPLPVIVNVPIIWPRGGAGSLTFPLKKGDGVLVVFAERSIDTWLSKGGDVEPGDPRKFDLSDAIAIPGLFPFTDDSYSENNDDVMLKFGSSYLTLKENGDVEIEASGAVKVDGTAIDLGETTKALITSDLISAFNGHTHLYIPGALTPVATATPLPALTAAIQTTKTRAQ